MVIEFSIMFPHHHFPELPLAKSLLIKGEYHPSAPIHFCISHLPLVNDDSTAVLITPSKESFVQTLIGYNDRWLGKCGGSGEVAAFECSSAGRPALDVALPFLDDSGT